MNCPSCKESKLVMSERKGIEIDYCPDCRGIWLDRGELDKIIEKSTQEMAEEKRAPVAEPQYRPDNYPKHDHYHKPYKRKKSFLEELFD